MIVDLSGDFFIVPTKTQQLGVAIETARHPSPSSEEGYVYNDPLRPSHILIQVTFNSCGHPFAAANLTPNVTYELDIKLVPHHLKPLCENILFIGKVARLLLWKNYDNHLQLPSQSIDINSSQGPLVTTTPLSLNQI